jgi:hypothetical protein
MRTVITNTTELVNMANATLDSMSTELIQKNVEEPDKITTLEMMKASDVFGDKAKEPDREVCRITTEKGARETHSLPKGIEVVKGEFLVTDKIAASRSLSSNNSWFGRFVRKYGKAPAIGQTVTVGVQGNGFLAIRVV